MTWIFKILNWNLANSETQIQFRHLCSTHGIIIKDFLASFHKTEKLFSQGQTKLDANSLFLNDSHSSGLQQSQNAINTHTLNINYTKIHHSLTVTPSTLIHNRSTQQPKAVYPASTPHGQLGSTWITTHILEEYANVRKGMWEKTNIFLGVQRRWETWKWTTNTMQEKHEWEQTFFLRTTVNGSEQKYLSGHSRSAASEGRDYPIFGNNLLPILQAADTGFPYFATRQACLCISFIMAQLICIAPLWVCSLSLHAAFLARIPVDPGKCCVTKWQTSTDGKLDVTVLFIRTGNVGITQWTVQQTTPPHPNEPTREASHYRTQQWPASLHPACITHSTMTLLISTLHIPSKHWYQPTAPHGVTTSNLNLNSNCHEPEIYTNTLFSIPDTKLWVNYDRTTLPTLQKL